MRLINLDGAAVKMARWLLLVSLLATFASAEEVLNNVTAAAAPGARDWMLDFLRAARMLATDCRRKLSITFSSEELLGCVELRTLRALDRLLARDVLDLPYGIKLIKDLKVEDDHVGAINTPLFDARRRPALSGVDMLNETLSRAARLLRTHSLRIPLPKNVSFDIFEGRRRHRKNDMMGLMLFGVMAMTVIAIPLGFQFLAVLGGKALMLAKLALILTSIQGLKKVATSNLNYGLYQAPSHLSRPWLYDRRWPPAHSDQEHGGLFDGFDVPTESHSLDGIRSRIMLPRLGFTDNGIEHQREQQA